MIITDLTYQRDVERWYPLKYHQTQYVLGNDDIRFKVVPAGRRSGKTERAKRFIAREALRTPNASYFIAAPTRPQVKKIYWDDMKKLCFTSVLPRGSVSETELTIMLPNGAVISLVGLDQPQRIEGTLWTGGLIDEIADVKPKAWAENISPALDTFNPVNPGYKAWCWLIGVPDGLNHYYEMAEYARTANDPEWKLYTWPSSDILPTEMIAAAKRRMSARQFRQEYEASFETAGGKIYSDYSADNHVNSKIESHEQLLWMHDFNYTPMSSAVGVRRDGGKSLYLLDEIILTSAVARQTAVEFCDKYKDHANRSVVLFGDPAGRAGEKHGHASDYVEIEKVLKDGGWKVERRVKLAAPAIRDRQNAVRAKIRNAADEVSLFVDPRRAPYCHKGLATVQTKTGSTFLEEDSEYQHITTAIGYCVDRIWPASAKKETVIEPPRGSTNHWKGLR